MSENLPTRIKVWGYINVSDLPEGVVDLTDNTGLTSDGYEAVMTSGAWTLADLEDSDCKWVNE